MGLIKRQLNRKVSKREKTKQRQNENSILCCVNICCPCYVTRNNFYTSINSLYNKNTSINSLYNKRTSNNSLYNKSTSNNSLYNKRTSNNSLYNKGTSNNSLYNKSTKHNLWSIFIWSSCNFFSIYQF